MSLEFNETCLAYSTRVGHSFTGVVALTFLLYIVQCVMLYVRIAIRAFLGPVIGGVLVQLVGFPSMAAVRNR